MIKKITIKNTATYKCSVAEPKKINYIYGGNGTGKTTLGRFISNPENMKNGNILHDNTDFEILTYNKDFVRENFDDTSAIKGIFTIGKESKEIELEIKEKIKEKQGLEDEIAQNNLTIEKLTDEALKERERLYDECWKAQKTYERYRKCFSGFRCCML